MKHGKVLMVMGTGSDVGKSLLVTGLCRFFARKGVSVAPFKAQNMSNNAAVTPEGLEIGRAQAEQARAAGLAPQVVMNPILLKPEGDARCQVVLMGQAVQRLSAMDYYEQKQHHRKVALSCLEALRKQHDLVIIEGAGSPAEINLRDFDLVNFFIAKAVQAPVLLVADIDRGGVFASLLGTLMLLEEEERRLVKGLVVNKFRGDPALFESGVRLLEQKSGLPVLGVLPYLKDLHLAAEDSVALDGQPQDPIPGKTLDIAVIRLPRIANHDDFETLGREPGTGLRYVHDPLRLGRPDLLILPGTKHTRHDLQWLRDTGLADAILTFATQGGRVLGICGGCQMLGGGIEDPHGAEGPPGVDTGLNLIPLETVFEREKRTTVVKADTAQESFQGCGGLSNLDAYEIHMGKTRRTDGLPAFRITHRNGLSSDARDDGASSHEGRITGTMLHGIFLNDSLRHALLNQLRRDKGLPPAEGIHIDPNQVFNGIADMLETHLSVQAIEALLA